jgi:hypothetical protein
MYKGGVYKMNINIIFFIIALTLGSISFFIGFKSGKKKKIIKIEVSDYSSKIPKLMKEQQTKTLTEAETDRHIISLECKPIGKHGR